MSLWKPVPDPDGGAGKQPSLMHLVCMKALCTDGLYHTMIAVEVEYEVKWMQIAKDGRWDGILSEWKLCPDAKVCPSGTAHGTG